jgi:hypothetical protein
MRGGSKKKNRFVSACVIGAGDGHGTAVQLLSTPSQKSNICVYVEPSTAGRVDYLVGLVVGESHELAERDTCYFTAASAAALAAVCVPSAAVGAAITAVAAAATIAISVVTTIAVSITAIYCCPSLVDCLAPA